MPFTACCDSLKQLRGNYSPLFWFSLVLSLFTSTKTASSENLNNVANAVAGVYVFFDMMDDVSNRYAPPELVQSTEIQSEYSLLPEWRNIEMDLGKGSLDELIDSKQFCGAMIYASRYIACLFASENDPGLRTAMAFFFLMPSAYQHNQSFNYEKADLPTILTIYSIKTSSKLLDIDMKASGLSHYSSAVFYVPLVIALWFRHSGMEAGSTPYFWLAVPKIFMSSMLTHLYKGTAEKIPACKSEACRYVTSGIVFLSTGLFLDALKGQDYLPKLDGLSASLTDKIGKLAGYGMADGLTEIAASEISDPFIYYGTSVVLLLSLTRATDFAHNFAHNFAHSAGPYSYVTGSLKRGLTVRTALAAIELKLLVCASLFKFIVSTAIEPQYSYPSPYVQMSELSEKCSTVPVPGIATELHRIVCPSQPSIKSTNELPRSMVAVIVIYMLQKLRGNNN
ncbi:hypothetical protein NX722_07760 [Endozoicomonas gorgoniicola]|uniref:Uncharacterized protein n=1 Tax=Endozoicomonas gorgoniicola TaxID=1234144 RepID=A0ABT3MT50_9GAMM|nr:hypothetical protein [Endozoicomonas gorgoniicola]MCW7552544.1 hypothetical protein [Endozoicomonas gorgoniicola]